jgi:hypothetical protein
VENNPKAVAVFTDLEPNAIKQLVHPKQHEAVSLSR